MLGVPRLINDLFEGFIFYIYRHVEGVALIARHPRRGPPTLAYRNLRTPERSVGPHAFLFLNLFFLLLFLQVFSPLLFVFWSGEYAATTAGETLHGLVEDKFDLLPLLLKTTLLLVTFDVLARTLAAAISAQPAKRRRFRDSLLFSLGLQPFALVLAFLFVTRFPLFTMNDAMNNAVAAAALLLIVVIAGTSVAFGERAFAPTIQRRFFKTSRQAPLFARLSASAAVLTILAIGYAVGIVLSQQPMFARPEFVSIETMECSIDYDARRIAVSGVVANRTGRLQPLSVGADNYAHAAVELANHGFASADSRGYTNYPEQILSRDTPVLFQTSRGSDSPYVVMAAGDTIWVRLSWTLRDDQPLPPMSTPGECGVARVCQLSIARSTNAASLQRCTM
jgi:hypothetical protein